MLFTYNWACNSRNPNMKSTPRNTSNRFAMLPSTSSRSTHRSTCCHIRISPGLRDTPQRFSWPDVHQGRPVLDNAIEYFSLFRFDADFRVEQPLHGRGDEKLGSSSINKTQSAPCVSRRARPPRLAMLLQTPESLSHCADDEVPGVLWLVVLKQRRHRPPV